MTTYALREKSRANHLEECLRSIDWKEKALATDEPYCEALVRLRDLQ